ncbi:MAG TPA: ABC transporter substrate-binding protein [Streptosporangiaceae bacterium]|jgi:peptide/nickel transport system substrate-binding protein|nr:ABC transporter substrate-binding protein [Streptosporangiaceae bacterium]
MDLGRHKWRLGGIAVLSAIALTAAGCGSSGGSGGNSGGSTSAGKVKGGTVTVAELPSSPPNYIFPFMSLAYFSVSNSQDMQYQMYRPLFWFGGNNTSPTPVYSISPANAPVYSNGGKTVVINMKGWKWSNGETVDANDVLFWLHMMSAELSNWAGAAPGGIPTNITSMKATAPNQVTLTLNKAYSSLWYTYNELAQVTPMPQAWDVTSLGAKSGSGGCTASAAPYKPCKAVYNFLAAQAKNTGSYASSPLWSVVDGPWKLSSFNTSGQDSFVPNAKYSGSPKPTIAKWEEVPFTSDTSEYTALQSGAVDIGYIPTQNLPVKSPSQALPPTNPLGAGYTLAPNYAWGFAYYQINWNNPQIGPVFKQLYARQALEYVSDQNGIAKATDRGYAYPTTGIAPAEPAGNQWVAGTTQEANGGQGPYPFSTSKAAALLTAHGWKMVGGTMTCETPSKCGAGIKAGTKFAFELDYSTGQAAFTQEAQIYKSDASKAGINIDIVGKTFNAVIGEALPTNHSWQGAMYGLWIFSPGYEPTGEPLFQTGAGSNSGAYSDPKMDSLINATETSGSMAVYHNFANYSAQQLPFIYMPLSYGIQAVNSKLKNVQFNPLQTLLPEYYYFTK